MTIKRLMAAACAAVFMAGASSAATITVTEGARAQIAGSTAFTDTGNSAFNLNSLNGGAYGAGVTIGIYGRIVGSTDKFTFTFDITNTFDLRFDFDGYDLAGGGSVAAGLSGLVDESIVLGGTPLTQNGPGGKRVSFELRQLLGGSNTYTTVRRTNRVMGNETIFGDVGAGRYRLIVSGDLGNQQNVPAYYDLELVSAVPLPASALLLLGGLGGLFAVRRRKTT